MFHRNRNCPLLWSVLLQRLQQHFQVSYFQLSYDTVAIAILPMQRILSGLLMALTMLLIDDVCTTISLATATETRIALLLLGAFNYTATLESRRDYRGL